MFSELMWQTLFSENIFIQLLAVLDLDSLTTQQRKAPSAANKSNPLRYDITFSGYCQVADFQVDSIYFLCISLYVFRKHWSIENQRHWRLDVIFREGALIAGKGNSPLNRNVLRKNALALLNQTKYVRLSKKMTFKAALNPKTLLYLLFKFKK
ncbi:MAG: hypothetical protein Q4D58_00995 [Synergistaceae bacterium]|nr:hypothetical protein [Synergistaceae bacterium]